MKNVIEFLFESGFWIADISAEKNYLSVQFSHMGSVLTLSAVRFYATKVSVRNENLSFLFFFWLHDFYLSFKIKFWQHSISIFVRAEHTCFEFFQSDDTSHFIINRIKVIAYWGCRNWQKCFKRCFCFLSNFLKEFRNEFFSFERFWVLLGFQEYGCLRYVWLSALSNCYRLVQIYNLFESESIGFLVCIKLKSSVCFCLIILKVAPMLG